ncbi:MAG: DUF1343 domain-containing protein [Muribaculaceae bacterium]|nr:DUF1343 domain-containing protein [Muribaculaceae bacterium]
MKLKSILVAAVALQIAIVAGAQVKPGIEVLRDRGFDVLQGKRVGLITNPTGVDSRLKSTIDILHEAPGVELKAMYSPEHGVRGDVYAGDHVDTYVDPATGVTVYSIYGAGHRPTDDMLKDIDVLVYDIQDNGSRSYTFISTMGEAMDACAVAGKEFMVLDRPNPLSGNKVEGNLVEEASKSFVSRFPIPYIYGLTPGELACYLNEEGLLDSGKKVDLTIVPMEGWTRDMVMSETGLPWIMPSPHVPYADDCLYYPATGILGELDYMSIGVGYTKPFHMFAAPFVDADSLCQSLTTLNIPGVLFRPLHFKPFYGMYKGENIQGVEVYITDPAKAPLSLIQFYVMQELARMYPDHKALDVAKPARLNMFDKVVGSPKIRELFARRYRVEDMVDYWNKDVESFNRQKARYHLYK